MEKTGLILDFTGKVTEAAWQDFAASVNYSQPFAVLTNVEDVLALFKTTIVAPLVIHATDYSDELKTILRTYQQAFGPMADFQAIVNSDPDPQFMANVFEFGIEQFFAHETWLRDAWSLAVRVHETLEDQASAEYKTMNLVATLRGSDATQIANAKAELGDLATYDYRAAIANGRVEEAAGNLEEAIKSYKSAAGINKMYRPASASLGDAYMLSGKVDEAIAVYQKLDKTNPMDIDRKASLASAFLEKGDLETAAKYAAEAEAIKPGSSRVAEIKAQMLIKQGKIGDAFGLIDQMSDVGPFFAAKLNDLGIKLSQAGKGKSALSLYNKAHRVVRAELRYKISLNSALACRKLGEYDLGLKYIARCAKEFGSMYPKLQRIRDAMLKEKAEKQAQTSVNNGADTKLVG